MQCPHCGMETSADELINMTPEKVIEYYYRVRAAGSRRTLKQLAKLADIPVKTIYNRKVDYDKQRAQSGYSPRKRRKVVVL